MVKTEVFKIHGVELVVDYEYSYDPGVWTFPNGDPGYPESEEVYIDKVLIGDIDITNLMYSMPEFEDKVATNVLAFEESKRIS